MKPKTITTYLINGNPNGLKTIFISNKNCKAFAIPRTEIDKIKTREEIGRPSLYFLINEDDNKIYIGETENFYERIKNHVSSKEFWNFALQFFSQNNDLTKADVKYLEHLSIKEITEIQNIDLDENKQKSSCPNLPEHQKSTIDEFFEDVKLITGFLGYNFFEKIEKKKESEIFYCKRNGIDARGIYQNGKFIILKDSKIMNGSFKTEKGKNDHVLTLQRIEILKRRLIGEDKQNINETFIILKKDLICNSPSQASCISIGNASNGWTEWKNKNGKTLDEVIRKNLLD